MKLLAFVGVWPSRVCDGVPCARARALTGTREKSTESARVRSSYTVIHSRAWRVPASTTRPPSCA